MHRASIVVAAFLMTVLSVCANLPAQATKEARSFVKLEGIKIPVKAFFDE